MEKYEGYLFVQFTSQKEGSYCPHWNFNNLALLNTKWQIGIAFFNKCM